MSRTSVHTFITAAFLLVLSLILYLYGQSVVEREMIAGDGMVMMCGDYCAQLESWDKAAGWIGLVAVSVSIGGVIFWEREARPIMEQASILRPNERAPGRMIEVATPLQSAVITEVHTDESSVRRHEEGCPSQNDCLTPLERVIRGY